MKCIKLYKFKKKHHYFTDSKPVLRRKTDNTLWISSHSGPESLASLFTGKSLFYFRRCKPFRDGYIIDEQQVWQFNDSSQFRVRDNVEAI